MNVKVGDILLNRITSGSYLDYIKAVRVMRLTKTQIITENNVRYDRTTGNRIPRVSKYGTDKVRVK